MNETALKPNGRDAGFFLHFTEDEIRALHRLLGETSYQEEKDKGLNLDDAFLILKIYARLDELSLASEGKDALP